VDYGTLWTVVYVNIIRLNLTGRATGSRYRRSPRRRSTLTLFTPPSQHHFVAAGAQRRLHTHLPPALYMAPRFIQSNIVPSNNAGHAVTRRFAVLRDAVHSRTAHACAALVTIFATRVPPRVTLIQRCGVLRRHTAHHTRTPHSSALPGTAGQGGTSPGSILQHMV